MAAELKNQFAMLQEMVRNARAEDRLFQLAMEVEKLSSENKRLEAKIQKLTHMIGELSEKRGKPCDEAMFI
jgi:predicted  nucleic acid-binding Zn-ribbon protein